MSTRVVHGSCILSCYYNGILMPNPALFLWTVVPVTLASCKLVENNWLCPCHHLTCGCFEVEQICMFPLLGSLLTYFPLGSFVITFKVVIKKPNSRLSLTQKILRPPDILHFQTLGLYCLILREKRREFPRKDCIALGIGSNSCEHWILA